MGFRIWPFIANDCVSWIFCSVAQFSMHFINVCTQNTHTHTRTWYVHFFCNKLYSYYTSHRNIIWSFCWVYLTLYYICNVYIEIYVADGCGTVSNVCMNILNVPSFYPLLDKPYARCYVQHPTSTECISYVTTYIWPYSSAFTIYMLM